MPWKKYPGTGKTANGKNQREYYLNEQMKAIQKELGEMDDAVSETEELEQKLPRQACQKKQRKKRKSSSTS